MSARVCARGGCGRPAFAHYFYCWSHQRAWAEVHRLRQVAERRRQQAEVDRARAMAGAALRKEP